MATIEEHSGYRQPAASDQDATPAPVADEASAAAPSRAAERDAHAHHRASAVARPDGSAAQPVPHSPSRFLADLVEAMLATATEARAAALDQARNDAKHAVETIHVQSADEADTLRRRADDDIAGIQSWAKAEMQRIREEAEQKIAVRKDGLGTELDVHAAEIEHRIDIVQRRVTAFEGEMEAFFAGLASATDPTTIALMAERMPESPRFDVAPEDLEAEVAVAEGHILEIVQAAAAEQAQAEATAQAEAVAVAAPADDAAIAVAPVEAVADAVAVAEAAAEVAPAEMPVEPAVGEAVEVAAVAVPAEVGDAEPAVEVETPAADETEPTAEDPAAEGVAPDVETGTAEPVATAFEATEADADRPVPEVHGTGEERRLLQQAIARPVYGPELPEELRQAAQAEPAALASADSEPVAPEPEPEATPEPSVEQLPTPDGIEEAGATRLAARLARLSGFSATRAQPAVPGIAPLATTRVSVSGLVSVAGIASFKRHLSTLVGVRSVSVNSSHDGGFLFSVEHEPSLQLAMLVTRFPGFTARIVSAEGDSIVVVAHDPTIEG